MVFDGAYFGHESDEFKKAASIYASQAESTEIGRIGKVLCITLHAGSLACSKVLNLGASLLGNPRPDTLE